MSAQTIGVLVGVDGSSCAETALRWAVADAAARHVPLTVATVVDLPRLADVPLSSELVATAGRTGGQTVDRAVALARDLAPDVPAAGVVETGDTAAVLLWLARNADEVVVGSHGHSRLTALLIGSVSAKLAEHAPVPAVVVRAPAEVGGRVVVGVDGSELSEKALEQGFAHADRHGLPLTVLHAYSATPAVPPYPVPAPVYPIAGELARLREDALRVATEAAGRWTEKYPEVPTRAEVAEGTAASRLVEASGGAALLVVGTRGNGGLAGMLLGSVSQAVTRHAHCPVVVAR